MIGNCDPFRAALTPTLELIAEGRAHLRCPRVCGVSEPSRHAPRDAASRRVAGAADALSLTNERRYWHTLLKKTIDRTRRVRS